MEFNTNLTIEEWTNNNDLAISIWNNKYKNGDETFMETIDRISGGNEEIEQLILEKKFLPGGRILSNRGLEKNGRKVSLSNCYVLPPVEDNLESIFDTAKKMARTFSYGGGVGLSLSKLAFKGAEVRNAAKASSGAVSFMELYSHVTGLISQNGRRGAALLSMDISHPDIEEFIEIKQDLDKVTKANISIQITDEFMNAVKEDKDFDLRFRRNETGEEKVKTVKARELFRKIAQSNYDMGEPGMLFWDTVNNYSLLSEDDNYEYAGVNPCVTGDTLILTDAGYKEISSLVGKEITIWNGYEWSIVTPEITGTNQPIRLIETSDGKSLECTDYHKFILEDGTRVEAKYLKIGDKLAKYKLPELEEEIEISIIGNTPSRVADKVYCVNEPKNHSVIFNGIITANCGEQCLPSYGACLLGSINLSEFVDDPFTDKANFNFYKFGTTVKAVVKELNTILDEGIPLHPLKEQQITASEWRQIGVGVMGISDMLIKMGIKYGSDESIQLCDQIGFHMAENALLASSLLASTDKPYPMYNKDAILQSKYFQYNATDFTKKHVEEHGLRNSHLLTIAPTGSLSNVLGVSGGIEPIFANSYTRKTETLHGEDTYYKVYTPIVKEYMDKHGITDEKDLPDYFVTSHEISYEDRIKMQAVWQSHIDVSISSTVNLPESATVEDIMDLYMKAWENGLKGITVFRDNCKRVGILTTEKKEEDKSEETKFEPIQGETIGLARGEVIQVSDNVVGLKRKLITGCGSLHCTAFFDPETGNMVETYLSKGSTGGCNNFMVGLSRMISLAARLGGSIYDIIDQLKSTGSCPSYAVRRATQKDTSIGSCCPMAVGNALLDMYEEFNGLGKYKEIPPYGKVNNDGTGELHLIDGKTLKVTPLPKEEPKMVIRDEFKCPQCGAKLETLNGCLECHTCGWTKCD